MATTTLAAGALTASLLLGASAASAETFTLGELKTDDKRFLSGSMLFSNWDFQSAGVNADNILIVTLGDPGSVGAFILRSTNDEFTAMGDGFDDGFDLAITYYVSVVGAGPGGPGDRERDARTAQLYNVTRGPACGFHRAEIGGLDLWFSQNVSGLPDRTVDADPLLLTPTSLSIIAQVGARTAAEGSIAAIDEFSTSFSVVSVPAAVWLRLAGTDRDCKKKTCGLTVLKTVLWGHFNLRSIKEISKCNTHPA